MATTAELVNILKGYFPQGYKGVLLEVGAAHPVEMSVSHVFRSLGWTIISIEPNPDFVAEFTKLELECLPYACCGEDKGVTDFHISPCPMSSSALEVRYPGSYPLEDGAGGWWPAKDFKVVKVEALTLDTVMRRHHPNIDSIDILIIDTEGWELDVLRGFDLARFSPRVVLFEYFWSIKESEGIFPLLESNNYRRDREEEQDLFYVLQEKSN
jgi:FkbM family methyltransferase